MGNINQLPIVLGSLRYKGSSDTNLGFKVPFTQTFKEVIEFDRTANIDLQQLFNDERQKSTTFRPSCKFDIIFSNSYTGYSTYEPFINNLFYTNAAEAASSNCNSTTVQWYGFPQYTEFDFIRNDYNAIGYTQPPNNHLKFVPKDAGKYNWNFYMSYAYDNNSTKQLQATINSPLPIGVRNFTWTASDGIPYVSIETSINGLSIIQFTCPISHGLNVGEFIKLSNSSLYNNIELFQVYSLGNGSTGSEEYILNILNPGFSNGILQGTFKRVILDSNLNESTSEYYVRRHKILTQTINTVIAKAGFDQIIFKDDLQYERAAMTPNNIPRVSIKNGSQSYTLSFNEDIDLNNIVDNQKRPISELFYTVLWKGYFGWTKSLKQGYEFNLPLNPVDNLPTTWWSDNNVNSNTNLTTTTYSVPPPLGVNQLGNNFNFIYTNELSTGDVIDGDLCEWNGYELNERVISTYFHKIRFNPDNFDIGGNQQRPFGYYYQPHFGIKIRQFSDYIEDAEPQNSVGIPNYASFSTSRNVFFWREPYYYGFFDSNGNGVSFPFMNGKHHPYGNFIFRIIPDGTNYKQFNTYQSPVIDGCE